jgi:hypothetical protein
VLTTWIMKKLAPRFGEAWRSTAPRVPVISRKSFGCKILILTPWAARFYEEEIFLLLCFQYFAGLVGRGHPATL